MTAQRITLPDNEQEDDQLIARVRLWALFNRPGSEIESVRLLPSDGERWVVIDWADRRQMGWRLNGHSGWRDPPPWGDADFENS
jgi:hypothetical protein